MKVERGWKFPLNTRKAHYFDDSLISLCGKVMVLSLKGCEDDNHGSKDNCVECRRRQEKIT